MRKFFPLILITLTAVLFINCKTETKKEPVVETEKVEVEKELTIVEDDGFREPTDDEIREFGIIKEVEDSQYPMFSITVEFPERKSEASFNLNVEKITLNQNQLYELKGNYATFYYVEEEETMAMDIHFKGKSLQGEYAPEIDDSYKSITGKLSGADSLSGDNPGKITITNEEESMIFEYFVDDDTMGVNNNEVTVYYYSKYINLITYLQKSED